MTYSIVARDKDTGELGVAVQSHYFQVGPVVPWAIAGVGAVATQSMVNVSFGPLGLDYLKAGYTAEQALKALLAAASEPPSRRVSVVDASGGVATQTGARCIPAAGDRTGDGFSVQANLMEKDTVWDAMFEAYTSTQGPLPERMLAALEAAEAEGGDIRGRQSAAMLVVTGAPTGRSWEDRVIELRVEDAPDPNSELRRLLRVKRAYMALNEGDRASDAGDQATAAAKLREALELAPEMVEISFWGGLGMAQNGMVEAGHKLIAYAAGRMRRYFIRITPGDRIRVELSPYDLTRGRIVYRYRD